MKGYNPGSMALETKYLNISSGAGKFVQPGMYPAFACHSNRLVDIHITVT